MERKRILIVDDEPDIVMLVEARLRANGFEVETANGGEEGLKKAKQQAPDLMLLDLMMPVVDGYAVLEALNSDEKTSSIPVMILSAKTQREDVQKAMDYGVIDFITKPIDVPTFMGKLDNFFSSQGA